MPSIAFLERPRRPARATIAAGAAIAAGLALAVLPQAPAHAAGETVNIWLTTTNDSGGRNVTRGLQQQAPISFSSSSAGASQTISVNETRNTRRSSGPAPR